MRKMISELNFILSLIGGVIRPGNHGENGKCAYRFLSKYLSSNLLAQRLTLKSFATVT